MSRLNRTILVLLLLVGIPYYWFVLDYGAPPAQPRPITIAQLRSLSISPGEPAPSRIRFERVSSQRLMGNRIAAGMGLRSIRLHTISYMVEYPEDAPVLIGAGITRADARRFDHVTFAQRAQARVTRALSKCTRARSAFARTRTNGRDAYDRRNRAGADTRRRSRAATASRPHRSAASRCARGGGHPDARSQFRFAPGLCQARQWPANICSLAISRLLA